MNNDRFTWEKGDIIWDDTNEQKNTQDNEKNEITCTKIINIGDIVRIKDTGRLIEIQYINYKVNNTITFDFAGSLYDSEDNAIFLYNRKDIENVIIDPKSPRK